MKILLVDDLEPNLDATECLLKMGCEFETEIITARYKEDALQIIRENGGGINILITDLQLGQHAKEAGIEICQLAKRLIPGITTVLMSAVIANDQTVQNAVFMSKRDDGENSLTPNRAAQMRERQDDYLKKAIEGVFAKFFMFDHIVDKNKPAELLTIASKIHNQPNTPGLR